MTDTLSGLSSMATRHLLAALCAGALRAAGLAVKFRSGGGVAIAQEIRDGAPGDLAVLAADALAALADEGLVLRGSVRPLFVSEVVAAVPADAARSALETEADLREALLGAARIAYSTGPSGTALLDLIECWGVGKELDGRLHQAPPGVPVGELLARGEADLGFQQRSELTGLPGIALLGPLPGSAAIRSLFAGAVLAATERPDAARLALDVLGSDAAAPVVVAHGMAPADR